MAYVISIANGKGGVGKTTTSIALGSSLAEMGHRVLLIDLDHNASLTLAFGEKPFHPVTYSKDLFVNSREKPIECVESGYRNLDLIPSNGNMVSLEGRSLSLHNSTMVLRLAIKSLLPNSYDFIVIDCPASLGYLTTNALTASDLLIIPTQAEFFSAYALQAMFNLIRDIRRNKNPDLHYRILITLLDLRLKDHITILNQLKKHLGVCLYKTMISVDTNLRNSHTSGVPINYLSPTSRGTLQYRAIAQELVENLKNETIGLREQADASNPAEFHNVPSGRENQSSTHAAPHGAHNHYPDHSLSDRAGSSPLEERKNGKALFCSYLGRDEDPQTMLAYPSVWNKCHRAHPIVSPSTDHQNLFCLSKNHSMCPLLQDKIKRSMPSDLRASMDKTEMLQYFRNWIRARIR